MFSSLKVITMNVLDSLEPVLKSSNHVRLDQTELKEFVYWFDEIHLKHWLSSSPFDINQLDETRKIEFLFVLNSISFCYWEKPKWQVQYKNQSYDGAKAMIACLARAIENKTILDPNYLANIQRDDLEIILQGNRQIPLFNERLKILKELGEITKKKFKGDFRYILDQAQNNALKLVDILVDNFPSFNDYSIYKGKKVEFRKRAQLLAADLSHVLCFDVSDKLTACADYKIPQALRAYGILQYSEELKKKITSGEIILSGSNEEIEIRAYTIHAVELLTKEIKKEIAGVTANQINDVLWLDSQNLFHIHEPYHLTRTTAY